MEINKFIEKFYDPENDDGLTGIIFKREAKKNQIRTRLKEYRLSDEEIEQAIDIIVKAEIEMEKVKRKYKGDDYSVEELSKFRKKLLEIQEKMHKDFDTKVSKLLKAKYEKAKKILAEQEKKNQH